MSTSNLSQLKQALAIAERIHALEGELASVLSGGSSTVSSTTSAAPSPSKRGGKRTMSPAARAKMAAAAKERWAKVKKAGK